MYLNECEDEIINLYSLNDSEEIDLLIGLASIYLKLSYQHSLSSPMQFRNTH